MKKKGTAKRVALLLLGLTLLGVLVWRAGPKEVLAHAMSVGWGFLWLILIALGWRTMAATGMWLLFDPAHRMKWLTVFLIRVGGESVNTLTPFFNMGGEPVKALMLKKHVGLETGSSIVLLDKTMFFLASLVFMVTGLMLGVFVLSDHPAALATAGTLLAMWVVGFAFLIRQQARGRLVSTLTHWLALVRVRIRPETRERLDRVDQTLSTLWTKRQGRLWLSFIAHMAGRLLRSVDVYVAVLLLGMTVDFSTAYFIGAVGVLVNTAFAFIPGALGAFEGGHGYVFELLGMSAAAGVSVGLIRRLRTWAFAAMSYPIVVLYPTEAVGTSSRGAEARSAEP